MPASESPSETSPGLIWTDGAPRSARFGDVYFSGDDGLAESRVVFLEGCGLPEAWVGRDCFTVAELGFGTGLNIVALLDLWRRERPRGGCLNIFSIEAFPLTAGEARRALSAWPGLAEVAEPLLQAWPRGTPGFHRIDLPDVNVTLDLAVGDVVWALAQWASRADAWFLDGFSPALNPDMWSPAVLDLIAARSAPDARLGSFTVAGSVRRSLAERGFQVEKCPGHGRKRERLEARLDGARAARTQPLSVAVIGAGIAGVAVVRALTEAGARVVVIEADAPGAGASGFPAALVTPRLDAGDALIAGLHAQGLERARELYRRIPGAVIRHGLLQLDQAPRDAARYARIAAQTLWTDGEMRRIDAAAALDHVDEPVQTGGLKMTGALTIRPARVLEAWLAGAERIAGRASRLDRSGAGWRVLDDRDGVLARVDAVVVASGWGAAKLLAELELAPVRGQADWVEGIDTSAIAWGGYVAPTGEGLLYGATHHRGDEGVEVRQADSGRNLAALRARLPVAADRIGDRPRRARAAVRATTPDRLPLCGPLPDRPGVYVLTGLGSRGFCLAPLLGEHLAAIVCDRPSPLPAAFADRLSAGRFDIDRS